jgi:hypothetical protein
MLEIIERAKAIVVTQLFVEPDQVIEAGKNYTVMLNSALGTITPAALTISAVTQTKVYDGTTASLPTPTHSGLVNSDTVSSLS